MVRLTSPLLSLRHYDGISVLSKDVLGATIIRQIGCHLPVAGVSLPHKPKFIDASSPARLEGNKLQAAETSFLSATRRA